MSQQSSHMESALRTLDALETVFTDKANGNLDFDVERANIIGLLSKDRGLAEKAAFNPNAFMNAILQQSVSGLTLNPKQGLAYLYVQNGNIVFSPTARGLITLGVMTGMIKRCEVRIVHKNDDFIFNGYDEKPHFKPDPFSTDRGPVIGAYAETTLPDGSIMIDHIDAAGLNEIKACSLGGNHAKSPWNRFADEMIKKSVIKRAAKYWPITNTALASVFDETVANCNEVEGIEIASQEELESSAPTVESATDQVVETAEMIADEGDIDPNIVNWMKKVLERTKQNQAWAAAEDYFRSQCKDQPQAMAFCLASLRAERQMHNQ